MDVERRYWAFLSYSHADRAWARWLHRALETYRVPHRLVGRPTAAGPTPRRFHPIFRDREELAADANLRDRVRGALERSSFLIVICSPAAAASAWVEDEIVRFKMLHGEAPVLAVIVAGAAGASNAGGVECFPPALRVRVAPDGTLGAERADPIAADLRPGGDGRRMARLKLLARMLEVGLDDLVHRDAQRRQSQLAALAGVLALVALTMGGLAAAALLARDEARSQRTQAEKLVAFMLGDLREKLEPLGRLDLLAAVGAEALNYYRVQGPRGLDDKALGQRARTLHLIGTIKEKLGDLPAAWRNFREASITTGELLARRPEDGGRIFDHAQSVYYLGEIAELRGQDQAALRWYLEYKRLAERLIAVDPNKVDWRAEVADADADVGNILLKDHLPRESLGFFRRAVGIDQGLVDRAPGDRDRRMDLAQFHAWLSDAERSTGADEAAIGDRLAERQIYATLIKERPDDSAAAEDLIVNRTALADIYLRAGRLEDAIDELARSTGEAEHLMATDRGNRQLQADAAAAFTALGDALLQRGAVQSAAAAAKWAKSLTDALVATDPTVEDWNGLRLGRVRLLEIEIAARTAVGEGACGQALEPAVAESQRLERLSTARPRDLPLAGAAAEAALLAGDYEAVTGRPDRARATWSRSLRILDKAGGSAAFPANDRSRAIMARALSRRTQSAAGTAALGVCLAHPTSGGPRSREPTYAW